MRERREVHIYFLHTMPVMSLLVLLFFSELKKGEEEDDGDDGDEEENVRENDLNLFAPVPSFIHRLIPSHQSHNCK